MTTFEGLDVEAVQAHGTQLKAQAQNLDGIIYNVANLVAQIEGLWDGQDAREFQGWWDSQHRPALVAASQAVAGLGQSALNNASEQAQASSVIGGTTANSAIVAGSLAGGVAAAALAASPATASTGSVGKPGASLGKLPDSGGIAAYRAAAQFRPSSADWAQGEPANGQADQWNKAANNCTSWAAFRRTELGFANPTGNGGAMGQTAGIPPTLGALVSTGAGTNTDPGHVMIAEEIYSPDRFRVSEMNYDGQGGFRDTQIWDKQMDGTWRSETTGRVAVLKFTP